MEKEQLNLNINLKNTVGIETPSGGKIFQQGYILRKISRFVVGTDEDAVLPIPIFFDPDSGKIFEGTVPQELREEFKDLLVEE